MNSRLLKISSFLFLIFLSVSLIIPSSLPTYGYYYDDEYPEIDNAYWDNRTARWDTNGYETKFEVRLYRNGHQVITKKTSQDGMYMGHYFTSSGDYYFDVRPYNRYTGWGNWMGSDCIYMDRYVYDDYYDRHYDDRYYDDRYYDDRYYDNRYLYRQDISYAKNEGPTANQGPMQNNSNIIMPGSNNQQNQQIQNPVNNITAYNKQVLSVPTPLVISQQSNGQSSMGNFVESYGVWHFIYSNGAPATNAWVQYQNKWYYIDMNGIMATGLYTINGTTYYLQTDGSMAVGTLVLDGNTHYFDNNGAMIY